MYVGHVACCPLVSHGEYADRTDKQMDIGQTDERHSVTVRFPLDAAGSLNHVVVSCGRKMFNVNASEIAAECLICLEFATSSRLWPRTKRYVLSNSVVCEICAIFVVQFSFYFALYILCDTVLGE